MTSPSSTDAELDEEQLASFHDHLKKSTRVLALLGAGLSAASGLPTFRGVEGLWRTHDPFSLATPEAFDADPALVWQFYSSRRQMASSAQPNAAHYALARLATKMPGFQALSQNVDGLSERANHPQKQLQLLHGTLFEVRCTDLEKCNYSEMNYENPILPALAVPTLGIAPAQHRTSEGAAEHENELDISDINVPLPFITIDDLPRCPKCKQRLLRPGVVWFGESLPGPVLDEVETFIDADKIDLILVIGTSARVTPAADYIKQARERGARVCVVNLNTDDRPVGRRNKDWFFQGDAAAIVPALLMPITEACP
ncbi:hypothetical protein LTR49_028342 [Elasticomyces elasticus]|nr:hypothetical protein LTR49_028342 [Elasticomyces elasticus]